MKASYRKRRTTRGEFRSRYKEIDRLLDALTQAARVEQRADRLGVSLGSEFLERQQDLRVKIRAAFTEMWEALDAVADDVLK